MISKLHQPAFTTKTTSTTPNQTGQSQNQSGRAKSQTAAGPHNPSQDLTVFGAWVEKPIWVPPKDCSQEMAMTMLEQFGPFADKSRCWEYCQKKHRADFTQVRKIELPKSSIRLPQGRLYVTVTPQNRFAEIEDPIPSCVQTRLDEFLAGPGSKPGVRVYYLKPLCVEVGSELVFTTRQEIDDATAIIKQQVFDEYRKQYFAHRLRRFGIGAFNAMLAIPRFAVRSIIQRKKREIEAYHAQVEFKRRKRAVRAMRLRKTYRSDECSYDEILSLTDTPDREEVIEHYVQEQQLANIDRKMFLIASAATLPWFATLSLAAYKIAAASMIATASVAVCDPAFVAEMPGSNGRLLKIGHFDEVDGVMHIEI